MGGPFDYPPDASRADDDAEEAQLLPPLARARHVAQASRCLGGLPDRFLDVDASRMALGFYCLSALDVLGARAARVSAADAEAWRAWIWAQQAPGGGFRPGPLDGAHAPAHLIMTYCALLSLAVLRDDFTQLDRRALEEFVRACQGADGGFSTAPGAGDADLRMLYCAAVVCTLMDDWTPIDVPAARRFVRACRTYEGGYGQAPGGEALGGTTYCALAALALLPAEQGEGEEGLTARERRQTVRWLVGTQQADGGFAGRTNKVSDACYCFWQAGALDVLGARADVLDADALAAFLARCQHVYGGIGKAPGETGDPYHTYLSLAALALAPPSAGATREAGGSWALEGLDVLVNGTRESVQWARERVPGR